ncbi:MAG: hypothetical protein COS11_03730 [bacterium (Candidatus Ratteibacteria) CG01_land_8_20_14_3_00_40_19]|uniref:EamA domain-containing protein n=1 Tax=bacterium (Candidatus Ratteibacteria) CG01_land_8_20_14_3_00_40_19 TaxID=2014290 RepID=A0A2M7E8Y0_9BACT|nr:MAG: hypothetical protein COS11_03730 [bacterium (Candidatus Ratteibacteria) CG01_land_8_20_14_3_00_40_19]
MLFTFLALIFFTLFGLCYKVSASQKNNPVVVNTSMLFCAGLISLFSLLLNKPSQYNFTTGALGFLGGSFFFTATLLVLYALKNGGKISICWTILNLGMVIPVLFSIFFWKESLELKKILGLVLIFSSIILIGQSKE